jgi:hypothetical protein
VDPFQLRGLGEIIGEEVSGLVSPVIAKNLSRLQIPEIPRLMLTMKEGNCNMAIL